MSSEKTDILIYIPFKEDELNESEINWIDSFQTILGISLHQITKQETDITRSYLAELATSKKALLEKSNVIIELLSKGFEMQNQLKLNDKELIRVVCHPELKIDSFSDYSINLFNETNQKPIDLSENINDLNDEIWLKFLDIAYEVKRQSLPDIKANNLKGKVFVAETSSDQNHNRETIIRELEHMGYQVLPHSGFSKDMATLSDMVYDNLSQAFLSIHIIGNHYAPLLNNIEISSIELQNDLFHEIASERRAQNNPITRLVWIPPNIKPKSEKQKLYIESFKRNIELLQSTEIIQTPVEVFKTVIKNTAKEILNKKTKPTEKVDEQKNKNIYVISNYTDSNIYSKTKEFLAENNIEVTEVASDISSVESIQNHYRNLINCDAILIDYSIDNIQWLNSKLSDIIKSPGFGRKSDFAAKTILVNTDFVPDIKLNIKDLDIVKIEEKDINKILTSFIEKIK